MLDSAGNQKHLEKVAIQVGLQQNADASRGAQLFKPESALAPLLLQHVHEADLSTRFAILLNQYKLVSSRLSRKFFLLMPTSSPYANFSFLLGKPYFPI